MSWTLWNGGFHVVLGSLSAFKYQDGRASALGARSQNSIETSARAAAPPELACSRMVRDVRARHRMIDFGEND